MRVSTVQQDDAMRAFTQRFVLVIGVQILKCLTVMLSIYYVII